MASQVVLILDFGGQYKELIARRVRECNVYSIVKAGSISASEVKEMAPIGIILTGGPNSVYDESSPHCDKEIFHLGIPVLGICYGTQLLAWSMGGTVEPCGTSEYGKTKMTVNTASALFRGLEAQQIGLMSHTDQYDRASRRLFFGGIHRRLRQCGDRMPRYAPLRHAVPPRGGEHAERNGDDSQFPL